MARTRVIDKDKGLKKILRRLYALHGMDTRAGVLSGIPRYATKGKTQVSRVAGVHGLHKIMGAVFDGDETKIHRDSAQVVGEIIDGKRPQDALATILQSYRDEVRAGAPVDTGLLRENIGAAVYKGKRHLAGDPHEGVEFAGPGF